MKKSSITLIFLSCLVFSLGSVQAKEREKLTGDKKEEVLSALDAYNELYQSFFNEEKSELGQKAKNLSQKIEKISHPEVSQFLKHSLKKLKDIESEEDFGKRKNEFGVVSAAFREVLKKFDPGEKYNVYYCPMVKKYWIQNSAKVAKVQNPYDGRMKGCGDQLTHF